MLNNDSTNETRMIPAKAIPRQFNLRSGDTLVAINGWETSYTLGIYQSSTGDYVSALLMGGYQLMEGFASVAQAHAFNRLVMEHPKLFSGTPSLEEFHARGGGISEAWNTLVKLKAKAQETTK